MAIVNPATPVTSVALCHALRVAQGVPPNLGPTAAATLATSNHSVVIISGVARSWHR